MDSAIKSIIGFGDSGLALYSLVVVFISLILGGLIGLEREMYGHAAGLRTHILLALGSTIVGIISLQVESGSWGLLAGVIIALGFLSAGSIVQTGKDVKGITTSSTLWIVGIIGFAIGAGYILESIVFTFMALIVLIILHYVEVKTSKRDPSITLIVDSSVKVGEDLVKIASTYGLEIKNISSKLTKLRDKDVLKVVVKLVKSPNDTIKAYADELESVLNPINISVSISRIG